MNEFEKWRTCTPEEYKESKRSTLDPAEMAPDTPYLWMVTFRGGHGQQPGRIKSVHIPDRYPDVSIVEFVTFDGSWHGNERFVGDKPDETNVQEGYFHGGLFRMSKDRESGIYFPIPAGPQTRVQEGYFIEDEDPSGPSEIAKSPDDGARLDIEEVERFLRDHPGPREPAGV